MALTPQVSIILPVLNAESFLGATLRSVFAQTYPHYEILAAIDPATSDRSREVLQSFNVKWIEVLERGVSAARNAALMRAKGRWIAFLDADDIWLPKKLELQIAADAALCATGFRRIDGKRLGRVIMPPAKINYAHLLKQNSLCCSSVMLDRERVGDVRFEDIGCEDYSLWLKLSREGHVGVGLAEALVYYRVLPQSRGSSKIKTARESWILLGRELSFVPAVLNFTEFLARGALKHSRF